MEIWAKLSQRRSAFTTRGAKICPNPFQLEADAENILLNVHPQKTRLQTAFTDLRNEHSTQEKII